MIFLCLASFLSSSAQQPKSVPSLANKQWQALTDALGKEDWNTAADLSSQYLKQVKVEDSDKTLARLRYMLLFASAGKVAQGAMTYEELELALKDFIRKEVEAPSRRARADCVPGNSSMNSLCLSKANAKRMSVAGTNRNGTHIFVFEYADLIESFDMSREGKFVILRGVIKAIDLNPNKSTIWVMRMFLDQGTLEVDQAHNGSN